MKAQNLYSLLFALLVTAPLMASEDTTAVQPQDTIIQIVYFNGNVTIARDSTNLNPVFGTRLSPSDIVTLDRKSSLQIAVNGKLHKYNTPGRIRLIDAIRRTKGERNDDVLTALRMLAEAGNGYRTVIHRMDLLPAERPLTQTVRTSAMAPASTTSEHSLVMLEPRTAAVTRGPLRFRWLSTADTTGYVVTLYDNIGMEVFRGETTDTTLVWDGAMLYPRSEYTWTLESKGTGKAIARTTFHRMDDIKATELEAGESRIRLELGSENPALPLLMAAFFSEKGCHGEAARYFTLAAQRTPEHFDAFMKLARDQYRRNMNIPESEIERIYSEQLISSATVE